ncbi:MAG: hypothetical protein L0229_19895 [Blastocatellia bacterium]|nr:hypothetical protein [Blastocatellia bacterium]
MSKKLLALFFVGLLICGVTREQAFARPQSGESVKAKISEYGVGKNTRISVKLKDKTKLKGYISEIKEDDFVLFYPKTGTTTPIAYDDVAKVNRVSDLGTWIGVIGGIAAILILMLRIVPHI